MLHLQWMPQLLVRIDCIPITSPLLEDPDVARIGQFRNDPLDHPFRDSHSQCHIA